MFASESQSESPTQKVGDPGIYFTFNAANMDVVNNNAYLNENDPEIVLQSMVAEGTTLDDWVPTEVNHIQPGWICHYSEDFNPCIMCYFDVSIDEWPEAFEDRSRFKWWGQSSNF